MLDGGSSDISEDIAGIRADTPLPHFPIAVVVDVFHDPLAILDDEDKVEELDKILGNAAVLQRMPRDTILARIISRESDKSDSTPRLFFPAMPFDKQPVKPGEHVFIFYSDPYRSTQVGYWLCRCPEPMDTDDLNFTHPDRKFEFEDDLSTSERASAEDPPPPGFMNGTGTEDSQSLAGDEMAYETINKEATAKDAIVKEPVARFTKRPGDRVIQGSNGTRIVLGMDRVGPVTDAPVEASPTIDMVATSYEFGASGEDAPPDSSVPRVIENARGELEVDKNPKKRNGNDNANEGDPDFTDDHSRIYISAKTTADDNFEIEIEGVPSSTGEVPAIVLKTDQVRLIAREDVKISVGENGAAVVIQGSDIIFIPAPDGVIKLGGADANKALVVNDGSNAGGTVVGVPIISTMGGGLGLGNSTQGAFATKVLVK